MASSNEPIAAITVPCIRYLGVDIPVEKILKEMKATARTIAKQSGIDI